MYQLVIPLNLHIETPLSKSYPAETIIFSPSHEIEDGSFFKNFTPTLHIDMVTVVFTSFPPLIDCREYFLTSSWTVFQSSDLSTFLMLFAANSSPNNPSTVETPKRTWDLCEIHCYGSSDGQVFTCFPESSWCLIRKLVQLTSSTSFNSFFPS